VGIGLKIAATYPKSSSESINLRVKVVFNKTFQSSERILWLNIVVWIMIIVKKGDITKEEVDAIVNPANSLGIMGGGVALAIKRVGGEIIEKEARKNAPIPVGEAVATSAGKLKCKYVIHAPTMEKPAMRTNVEKVRLAVRAALKLARKLKLKSIAFPGMGTGVGGVSYEDAAKVMIEECMKFKDLEIILVAFDEGLFKAFQKSLPKES